MSRAKLGLSRRLGGRKLVSHKGPFLGLTVGSRWKGAAGEGWAGAEPRGGGVLSRGLGGVRSPFHAPTPCRHSPPSPAWPVSPPVEIPWGREHGLNHSWPHLRVMATIGRKGMSESQQGVGSQEGQHRADKGWLQVGPGWRGWGTLDQAEQLPRGSSQVP